MNNDFSKHRFFTKSKYLFLLVAILLIVGCNYTKENYLSDFVSFIEEVKVNGSNYSEDDWIGIDKQYDEYATVQYEKFKPELTTEEMLIIGKLQATYVALKVKKGAGELFDQAKKIYNQTKEVLDSTVKTINK